MTYHTILKDSHDFIEALKSAREVADNITLSLSSDGKEKKVFPYRLVLLCFLPHLLPIVYGFFFTFILLISYKVISCIRYLLSNTFSFYLGTFLYV